MIKAFKDEYRWLSNFVPAKIVLDGVLYLSVEHAYQSAKSDKPEWKRFCQTEINPVIVKRNSKEVILLSYWDNIKDDIMEYCIRQKYNQAPYKQLLLNTKDQIIQEGNYWGDKYWGICLKTGEGQNKLGRLIMQIRDEIISDQHD
jgi:ribA/ribD-fused uncharacterized protein